MLVGILGAATMRPEGRAPTAADQIALLVLSLVTAAGFGRAAVMRIDVDQAGVRLVRFFGSAHIPWGDIEEVQSGYFFTIKKKDGTSVSTAVLGDGAWRGYINSSKPSRGELMARRLNLAAQGKR